MTIARPPYLGAAYYPEDWPLEQIDRDIELMHDAGITCARIGEFAWSRMEPQEGRYDFDWLHRAVDALGAAGIAVVMGTPTCTPPAWLYYRYPQIVGHNMDGPLQHGARRHACPTNRTYRELSAGIVTKMAQEFGQDPSIVGWQIDNELYPIWVRSDHGKRPLGCFCPSCCERFRQELARKYGTVEALNAAWGTDLWSQTYDCFEHVPCPPRTDTWHHPSLMHAWLRFQSDMYVEFTEVQADIIHRLASQPVGTDMMPFNGLDYQAIHRKLDFVQFNHYNNPSNLWEVAFWMDLCRAVKERPWWNTETSTCWSGGTNAWDVRPAGYCRANSWAPIALGAEANLYWLWRSHWSGQEMMHGSVITAQGRPMHIYAEVQEIARGFDACAEFLRDSRPVTSGLAMHTSHVAWVSFMAQGIAPKLDYPHDIIHRVYGPLADTGVHPEVIMPGQGLEGHKVLVSSLMPILDDQDLRAQLEAWIRAGGIWVAGPLTDVRTAEGTKFLDAPYGVLEGWGQVENRFQVPACPSDYALSWTDGAEGTAGLWADSYTLRGAKALASYVDGPLAGQAAITEATMGKGKVILLGTMPDAAAMTSLIARLAGEAGCLRSEGDRHLLAVERQGPAGCGLVAVELGGKARELPLARKATDLLTEESFTASVSVAPYGVRVLKYD